MSSRVYESHHGTALSAVSTIEFTRGPCKFISILLLDFAFGGVIINLSYDGVTFGDDIHIMAYFMPHVLDFSCRAVKIRRKAPFDTEYNIVVSY